MSWAAWQPWVIGGIAVLVMLRYVVRALFSDRARGRPRCLRCGHPFVESQGLTCTECGWTARRPSDLLRTRRHWGKAATAIAILIVAAVAVRLVAVGGNPLVLLPSRVLVAVLPIDRAGISGIGPVADILRGRLLGDALDDRTTAALLARVVVGDGGARPTSLAWQSRYGRLADELRRKFGRPDSPEAAELLALPPAIEITVPESWPADQPVPAAMTLRDWWPLGAEAMISIAIDDANDPDETAWHRVGYRNHASIRRRHHFTLPPPEDWPADDRFTVDLGVGQVDPSLVPETSDPSIAPAIRSTSVEVAVLRPSAIASIALEPWPGDENTSAAVGEVFRDGLRRWSGVRRPYAIRFNPRRLMREEYAGVFFGLVVEIVERRSDGTEAVHRRTRIWTPGGDADDRRRAAGWTISEEDTEGLAGAFDETNDSTWLMRIRGDEALARLAACRATPRPAATGSSTPPRRWWSGSVERSLPVDTVEGRPFIRMWFHPDGVEVPR